MTTCWYADHIGIGYVAGRDMTPDIEKLIPLTQRSLIELEAAVGVTTTWTAGCGIPSSWENRHEAISSPGYTALRL